ncbi:hypothetical protein Sjap_012226 [Stephania japonica]|uniref:Uncharacterized protein n=1 Tax=Stephania japonica TaxID=461633 RepID=A0AAP0IVN7_9MAGN
MEARRDNSGLYLTQTAYIQQLLRKSGMSNAKPIDTPFSLNKPLYADGSPLFHDTTLYRSILGGLQYLVNTRPDISFIVNKLSQFQQNPTVTHWQAVKRVLRYIKGTDTLGISFRPSSQLFVTGFSDADWASSPDDRRSIAGYAVFLGPNLVAWQSKKQAVVSRSSTESEYRAMAQVTAEISWLMSLLTEIHISISAPPTIWCDNMSAAALARNPVYHVRTKHIELDIHYVRDKVRRQFGRLGIHHVPTRDQLADIFTKGFFLASRFQYLRDKLGVRSALRLRGDVRINH